MTVHVLALSVAILLGACSEQAEEMTPAHAQRLIAEEVPASSLVRIPVGDNVEIFTGLVRLESAGLISIGSRAVKNRPQSERSEAPAWLPPGRRKKMVVGTVQLTEAGERLRVKWAERLRKRASAAGLPRHEYFALCELTGTKVTAIAPESEGSTIVRIEYSYTTQPTELGKLWQQEDEKEDKELSETLKLLEPSSQSRTPSICTPGKAYVRYTRYPDGWRYFDGDEIEPEPAREHRKRKEG